MDIYTDSAGLLSVAWEGKKEWEYTTIHFFPLKDIQWGYREDWCDGPLYSFGLGPFLLVCWSR